MSAISFAQTSLPPVVRVSNSADAPVRVASGTVQKRPAKTVFFVGEVFVRETQLLPPVRPSVELTRGRRLRRGKSTIRGSKKK